MLHTVSWEVVALLLLRMRLPSYRLSGLTSRTRLSVDSLVIYVDGG